MEYKTLREMKKEYFYDVVDKTTRLFDFSILDDAGIMTGVDLEQMKYIIMHNLTTIVNDYSFSSFTLSNCMDKIYSDCIFDIEIIEDDYKRLYVVYRLTGLRYNIYNNYSYYHNDAPKTSGTIGSWKTGIAANIKHINIAA